MPYSLRPPGFGAGVEDGDLVAVHGEAMGAGEPGRAGADDGDALAGRRGAREGLLARRHQRVGGVALEFADLRPACPRRPRGRRPPRRASRSGRRGRTCRRGCSGRGSSSPAPRGLSVGDLADEQRDVDPGRAGRDAGRVVAEVAAVGLDPGLVPVERRVQVGESPAISGAASRPARMSAPVVMIPPARRGGRAARPPARLRPGACGFDHLIKRRGACQFSRWRISRQAGAASAYR